MNELWLPVLISSVACLAISLFSRRVLPFHAREHRRLASEPEVLDALRRQMPAPGMYSFPYRGFHGANTERADVAANLARGPVGYVFVGRSGPPRSAGALAQHFLFFLIVAILSAYIATISGLKLGAPFLNVFRIVAIVATMGFVLGATPQSIWFSRPWRSWMLDCVDGIACAAGMGAVFGYLWPQ